MTRTKLLLFAMALFFILSANPVYAQSQTLVVNSVLFYSPTCPHCHKVMTEDFPPLREKYGSQLNILEVNVTEQEGSELYQSAITTYNIPQARRGVPALIVGETLLVGSDEIPSWFPSIIENGLKQGGIAWPSLPGLTSFLENHPLQTKSNPLTMGERFALDPVGNSLAVVVLVGMLVSVSLAGYAFMNRIPLNPWPEWVLPLLVVLGLGVAGYLTYIETTQTEAICGPIGDCNLVQQSEFARLFGVLPIGILGLVGYAGIGVAWMIKRYSAEKQAKQGALAVWGLALLGTVFSIYLTFLEPFIIGATCAWCLSSAVIMALLLWASTPVAQQATERSRKRRIKMGRA